MNFKLYAFYSTNSSIDWFYIYIRLTITNIYYKSYFNLLAMLNLTWKYLF